MKLHYEFHISDSPLGTFRDNVKTICVKKHKFKNHEPVDYEPEIRSLLPDIDLDEVKYFCDIVFDVLTQVFAIGWLEAYYWFTPVEEAKP